MFRLIDILAGRWIDWRTDRAVKHLPPEFQDFNLKKVEAGDGNWNIVALSPAVAIIADQAADLLEAHNAENYVQFHMMPRIDRGLCPILVTVAWANGEAPAKRVARLEAELARVQALCDEYEAAIYKADRVAFAIQHGMTPEQIARLAGDYVEYRMSKADDDLNELSVEDFLAESFGVENLDEIFGD
jgi:hypothetical protein